MAEAADELNTYQYAGNNPISFNDPMGDMRMSIAEYARHMNMQRKDPNGGFGNPFSFFEDFVANDPDNPYGPNLLPSARAGNPDAIALLADLYGDAGSVTYTRRAGSDVIAQQTWTDPNTGAYHSFSLYNDYWQAKVTVGDRSVKSDGPLTATSLMEHYLGNSGTTYNLSQSDFNTFLNTMNASGELNKIKNKGIPVANMKGLYQVTVDTYGTSYERVVGLATLYYNNTGFVGLSDWWNFDPKPWGTRSISGEALTRLAHSLQPWGVPFYIIYGITPPTNTIPRH